MSARSKDWEYEQLHGSALSASSVAKVTALLDAWYASFVDNTTIDVEIAVFTKLVHGHAIILQTEENELWMDARPGNLVAGEIVRVKADAYVDKQGELHNGRRGRIVAVRYGDIRIKYTDGRQPNPEMGAIHPPQRLEKKVN